MEKIRTYTLKHRVIAFVLLLCMIMSMFTWIRYLIPVANAADGTASTVTQGVVRTADPSTMYSYDKALNLSVSSRNAGRLWADKTVFAYGASDDDGFDVNTLTLHTNEINEGGKGSVSFSSDFLHVFSVLGSSIEYVGTPPTRTVIVFDNSASMYDSADTWEETRIYKTVEAINKSIDLLMEAGPYNEVAVILFGNGDSSKEMTAKGIADSIVHPGNGGNTAEIIVPMNHYEPSKDSKLGYTPYIIASRKNITNNGDDITFDKSTKKGGGFVFANNAKLGINTSKYTSFSNGTTNVDAGIVRGMQELLEHANKKVTIGSASFCYLPNLILLTDGMSTDMIKGTFNNPKMEARGFVNDTGNRLRSYVGYEGYDSATKDQTEICNFWDMFVATDTAGKYYTVGWEDYGNSTFGTNAAKKPVGKGLTAMKTLANNYSSTVGAMLLNSLMSAAYYKTAVENAYEGNTCDVYTISVDMTDPGTLTDKEVENAVVENVSGHKELPNGYKSGITLNAPTMDPEKYFNDLSWLEDKGYVPDKDDIDVKKTVYPDWSIGEMIIKGISDAKKAFDAWASPDTSDDAALDKVSTYQPWNTASKIYKDASGKEITDTFVSGQRVNPWNHTDGYLVEDVQQIKYPHLEDSDEYGVTDADVVNNINYVKQSTYVQTSADASKTIEAIFNEIVEVVNQRMFAPVKGTNDLGVGNSVTYMDPVGKYMDVKNVTNLLLFGEMHGVVKTAVYDYQWNELYMKNAGHPETALTNGWYKGTPDSVDGNKNVQSCTKNGELPDGCKSAADAWADDWVYRVGYTTAAQFVPTLSSIRTDTPDDIVTKQRNTVYTFYRLAEDDGVRTKLHVNPAYLETKEGGTLETEDEALKRLGLTQANYDTSGNGAHLKTQGVYALADIRIWVEDTGDYVDPNVGDVLTDANYDEALWINIPVNALPTRLVKIDATGDTTKYIYDSNHEALPLRLFYEVGMASDMLNANGTVNIAKISQEYLTKYEAQTDERAEKRGINRGDVEFFSNWYNTERTYDGYGYTNGVTFGDPVVTFSPADNNRYYLFQRPVPLYKYDDGKYDLNGDGTPDELSEGVKVEGAALKYNNETIAETPVTNASEMDADGWYYVVLEYFKKNAEGKADKVYVAVPRKGSEFGSGIGDGTTGAYLVWSNANGDVADITTTPSADKGPWYVSVKEGGLRAGNMRAGIGEKKPNITLTAENYYVPTVSATTSAATGESSIDVYLGNNGRLVCNSSTLLVTKRVAEVGDKTDDSYRDHEFKFQIFIEEMSGKYEAIKVRYDEEMKTWQRVLDYLDLTLDGRMCLQDANGQTAVFDEDGNHLTGEDAAKAITEGNAYYAYMGSNGDGFNFRIFDKEGTEEGKDVTSKPNNANKTKTYSGTVTLISAKDYASSTAPTGNAKTIELVTIKYGAHRTVGSAELEVQTPYLSNSEYAVRDITFGLDSNGDTLTAEDLYDKVIPTVDRPAYEGYANKYIADHTAEFKLKHNEGLIFTSIPKLESNPLYRVTEYISPEEAAEGYDLLNVEHTQMYASLATYYKGHNNLTIDSTVGDGVKTPEDSYEGFALSNALLWDSYSTYKGTSQNDDLPDGGNHHGTYKYFTYEDPVQYPNGHEHEVTNPLCSNVGTPVVTPDVEQSDGTVRHYFFKDGVMLDRHFNGEESGIENNRCLFTSTAHFAVEDEAFDETTGHQTGKYGKDNVYAKDGSDDDIKYTGAYSVHGTTGFYEETVRFNNAYHNNKTETAINGEDPKPAGKSDDGASKFGGVALGDKITYQIKWANTDTYAEDDVKESKVVITDKLDDGVDFVSAKLGGITLTSDNVKDGNGNVTERVSATVTRASGESGIKGDITIEYDADTHTVTWTFTAEAGAKGEVELVVQVNERAQRFWDYDADLNQNDDDLVRNRASIKVGNSPEYNTNKVENPVGGPDKTETNIERHNSYDSNNVKVEEGDNLTDKDRDGVWVGPTVYPGDKITYRIDWENFDNAEATVIVKDWLDKNVEFVSTKIDGQTVNDLTAGEPKTVQVTLDSKTVNVKIELVKGGNGEQDYIEWTFEKAPAGFKTAKDAENAGYIELVVKVKEDATAAGKVDNVAAVTVENHKEQKTKTIENPTPNPEKTETAPGDGNMVAVGDTIEYKIKWRNYMGEDARVIVYDKLDPGVTYANEYTLTVTKNDSKDGIKVVNDSKVYYGADDTYHVADEGAEGVAVKKHTLLFDLGVVPAGAEGEITFKVTVKSDAKEGHDYNDTAEDFDSTAEDYKVFNQARVKVGNDPFVMTDKVENPVTDKDETKVNGEAPNPGVTTNPDGSEQGPDVKVGDKITYKIHWENAHDKEAWILIVDTLDPGVKHVSHTLSSAITNASDVRTVQYSDVPASVVTGEGADSETVPIPERSCVWLFKAEARASGDVELTVEVTEKALSKGHVDNQADVKVNNEPVVKTNIVRNDTDEGGLFIEKNVVNDGGFGVSDDTQFKFVVTLDTEYMGTAYKTNADGTTTELKFNSDHKTLEFTLANGESVFISGIEEGTGYTVTEKPMPGYQNKDEGGVTGVTVKGDENSKVNRIEETGETKVEGTIPAGDKVRVEITYNNTITTDTNSKTETKVNGSDAKVDVRDDGVAAGPQVGVDDTITYEINWVNDSGKKADVVVTDTLDVGVDFVSAGVDGKTVTLDKDNEDKSVTDDDGITISYDDGGKTVTWELGEQKIGATGTVTLTVRVNDKAVENGYYNEDGTFVTGEGKDYEVENRAVVNVGNESSVTNVVENPVPEKEETEPGNGKLVGIGDSITYQIHWKNSYDRPAKVVIVDPLDIGVDFVSASCDGVSIDKDHPSNAGTDAAVEIVYDSGSHTVTWTFTAEAMTEGDVELTVKTNEKAFVKWEYVEKADGILVGSEAGGKDQQVINKAVVSVDNHPEFTSQVENPVPEKREETPGEGQTVKVGDKITYEIDWKNGEETKADVIITDVLDMGNGGVDFVSASYGDVELKAGETYKANSDKSVEITYNEGTDTVVWTIHNVEAGKPGTVSLTVEVNETARKVVENRAEVNINNRPSVTNTVENPKGPSKTETKVDGNDVGSLTPRRNDDGTLDRYVGPEVKVDDEVEYEITWVNDAKGSDGSPIAADVTVTDQLDKGVDFVGASFGGVSIDNEHETASGNDGVGDITIKYDKTSRTVTWTLKNRAAATSGTVKLTVEVNKDAYNYWQYGEGETPDVHDDRHDNVIVNRAHVAVENGSSSYTNIVENPLPTGGLVVKKTVKGTNVDTSVKFKFTLTFDNYPEFETDEANGKVFIDKSATVAEPVIKGKTVTFELGHGEYIRITGLPIGTTFTVEEETVPGYVASVSKTEAMLSTTALLMIDNSSTTGAEQKCSETGTIDEDGVTVEFINTNNGGKNEKTETVPGEGKSVVAGDKITYEIDWLNDTGDTAAVTVTDHLDDGVDFVSASVNGTDIVLPDKKDSTSVEKDGIKIEYKDHTVTWTFTGKKPGDCGTVTLTVEVNEKGIIEGSYNDNGEFVAGTGKDYEVVNRAVIQVAGHDPKVTNEVENPIPEKTEQTPGDGVQVGVGETIEYLIHWKNTHDDKPATIVITDPLDIGATFKSASIGENDLVLNVGVKNSIDAAEVNGGITNAEIRYDSSSNTVMWSFTAPAGADGDVVLTITVNENAYKDWSYNDRLSSGGTLSGSTGTGAEDDDQIVNKAVVSIDNNPRMTDEVENPLPKKTETVPGEGKPVGVGETITYEIEWKNGKDQKATVKITDDLDDGVTFVSADNDGKYDKATHTVTWILGEQTAGASGKVTLTVKVNEKAVRAGHYDDKGSFVPDSGDDHEVINRAVVIVDNKSVVTNEVENPVGEKTELDPGDGRLVDVGDKVTYNIHWKNREDKTAKVVITDTLDAGVDFESASIEGFKLSASDVEGSYGKVSLGDYTIEYKEENGQKLVIWTLENRTPGAEGDVVLVVTVNETAFDKWTYEAGKDSGILDETEKDFEIRNRAKIEIDNESHYTNEVENPLPKKTEKNPGEGNPVGVGEEITYEIEWRNDKDTEAVVTVIDKLDIGVDFVYASNGGKYDAATHTVTWELDKKAAGDHGTVTLTVKVNADAKVTWTYDETGSGDEVDAEVWNRAEVQVGNDSYYTNEVENPVFEKEETEPGDGEIVGVGEEITYRVYWKNNQSTDAKVVVTDQLDDGVDFKSASDPGKYDDKMHTVTWDLGEQEPGASGYVELTVTVNEDAYDHWQYGTAKGKEDIPETSGSDDNEVVNRAKVEIGNVSGYTNEVENPLPKKTEDTPGDGKPVEVGDNITYTIDWKNGKDQEATVKITDKLDDGVDFVSADNGGEYDAATRTVTWDLGKRPAGVSGKVTLTVKVNENAVRKWTYEGGAEDGEIDSEVVNRAEVEVDNKPVVTNEVENPVFEKEEVEPGDGEMVDVGDTITYKVYWKNYQDKEATVIVTDQLDDGVDFESASKPGRYDAGTHTVEWDLGKQPAGASGYVELTVKVNASAYDHWQYGEGDTSVTSGSDDNEVVNRAKVEIGNVSGYTNEVENPLPKKTEDDPGEDAPVKVGDKITYTIEWKNGKDQEATVEITDELDDGVDFESASNGGVYDEDAHTVTWDLGKQPAGASGKVTLTVVVNEKAVVEGHYNDNGTFIPGSGEDKDHEVVNRAVVIVDNKPFVTNEVDNPVPEKEEVDPGEGKMVGVGDEITYRVYWKNTHDEEATVTVTDVLDKGVDFKSASEEGSYDSAYHTVTWDLGKQKPGASGYVELTVVVNENAVFTWDYSTDGGDSGTGKDYEVKNRAKVQIDNDSAYTSIVENPVPEKEEVTPGEGNTVQIGDEITYTIHWKNGHDTPADVIIKDELDDGVDFVSADNGGVYDDATHTVTWTLKGMAAGADGDVELVVKVNSDAHVKDEVVNDATVQVGNDSEVKTEPVENPLGPSKTESEINGEDVSKDLVGTDDGYIGPQVKVGDEVTYVINWVNNATDENGNAASATVVIKDPLDAGVDFVSADNGGVYDEATRTVKWDLGEQEANASGSVTLTVKVNKSAELTWQYDKNADSGTSGEGKDHEIVNRASVKVGNENEVYTDTMHNPIMSGDLVVSKTVTGIGDKTKEWNFTVTLSDKSVNGEYGDMTFEDGVAEFTLKDGESATAKGLPAGITYEVVEAEANSEGYSTTSTGESGTIPTDYTAKAEFTNDLPEPDTGSLTVTKTVTGIGDKKKEWNFTVTLSDTSVNGEYGDMTFENGVAEFTLKDGESATADGLPADVTYTVVEAEANKDGYTTESTGETGTITKDDEAIAEFTNYLPEPENGSLRVTKTVSGAGDRTKEWHFTVTLSDTTINGEYGDMTFENGVAEFTLKDGESAYADELPAGITYTVVETEADVDGYTTTANGAAGTIPEGGTANAQFTNYLPEPEEEPQTGSLRVTKTVSGVGDTDREWHFTVTLSDTSINGRFGTMTFDNGVSEFTLKHGESAYADDLPAGITYTVVEAEANTDGYATTANGATGTIPAGGTANAEFTNYLPEPEEEPQTGSLRVTKTVSGVGDTDREWNFTVTLSDTTINGEYGDMTFTNGVAEFMLKHGESRTATELPAGITYTVVETEADADGYTTTANGAAGTIPEGGTANAQFTNYLPEPERTPQTGSLRVTKTVSGVGDAAKLWHFTVTLSDTSINGRFGTMTFADGVAEFTLRHGESAYADDLPADITYTVVEAEANTDGYATTANGATGTIPAGGTASAEFTNNLRPGEPTTGSITVTKTVTGVGDTDREWNFTVTLSDTTVNGVYGEMTFTDGVASFTLRHGESRTATGLPAGITYMVVEAEANIAGYTTTATGERGEIPAGGTAVVEFVNNLPGDQPTTGDLTVTKIVTGEDGDREKQFTFTVTLSDTTVNGIYGDMVFTNGTATFHLTHGESKTATGLPAGITYTVVEAEANSDGYSTLTVDAVGTIPAGGEASAEFENRKNPPSDEPNTGSLTVTKTVQGNAANTMTRFTFTVTLSDTTINGTYGDMTFVNGVATFRLRHGESATASGLPAGIGYTVTEAEPEVEGYVIVPSGDTGTIPNGGVAYAEFINYRNITFDNEPSSGPLAVRKVVTGADGERDREWHFVVTLSDTTINGVYGDMTFVNGVAQFTLRSGEVMWGRNLPVGVGFTVAEVEADTDGYDTIAEGTVGTILSDVRSEVRFQNHRGPWTPDDDEPWEELEDPDIPLSDFPFDDWPTSPKTGDISHLELWLPLLMISAVGIAVLAVPPEKKKRYGRQLRSKR